MADGAPSAGHLTLHTQGMAHGGEAVARHDGKACFVAGALPGEQVVVRVVKDAGSWARAELVEVLEASPERRHPPCPHAGACGGCQWQHASHPAQLGWKREIVAGQLRHLAGLADPPVREMVAPGPELHYRNRMDFHVAEGRPAFSRWRSRQLVPLDECLLLAPPLVDVFGRLGDLGRLRGLVLRAGMNTGDLLAVISGPTPPDLESWGIPVCRVRRGVVDRLIGRPFLTERVAGATFRITGNAFFQNNTAGAEELAALVHEALEPTLDDVVVDAYAGGGLFSVAIGARAGRVIAVERSGLAINDLLLNLERNEVYSADVIAGAVEQELPELEEPWDLAIADPPRTGLGRDGVAALVGGSPRALAYVSCDPASFARDTTLLRDAGYELEWVSPVDLFPQTYHVELVGRFAAREP